MEKYFYPTVCVLAGIIFVLYIVAEIHCWNIPISAREGVCAMLH